jgi:hypothetical protein
VSPSSDSSRERTDNEAASWPNNPTWAALKNEETVATKDGPMFLWTVACGDLLLPSGRLVACDPFVFLEPGNNSHVVVPAGRFPVIVTLADVSPAQDRSHVREAYASIVFRAGAESHRKALPLAREGEERPDPESDDFVGFGVDAGTACFVDDAVVGPCMPDPSTWYADLFENQRPECWFNRMDDPNHIREGIANIVLPLAKNGENLVLFHSGWGDGVYPVIGSFDGEGRLLAAHIDFFVMK